MIGSRAMKLSKARMILAILFTTILVSACPFDGDSPAAGSLGSTEIDAVLSELQQLQSQLDTNAVDMLDLQTQISTLEHNTIPCTLDRFLNDQCDAYNQPFDLTMTLCGETAGSAEIGGSFAVNNNNTINLGAGWDWGVDVNLGRAIEFPGIPGAGWATLATTGNPAGFVFGSPFPNLQAGVSGAAELGLSGCIDIPVSIEDVPRDQVIALMQEWEARGEALQQEIIAASERLDLVPDRIVAGLSALEVVQSKNLSAAADAGLSDPFEIFSRGSSLGKLLEVLPIGDRMQQVLDDPGVFVEPMAIDIPRAELADIDATCALFADPAAPPLLGTPVTTACRPLRAAPNFDELVRLVKRIGKLPNVNKIKNIVCDNVLLNLTSTVLGCRGS
jgi:hypothetical protein